jgi:hypothetical protein
VVDLRPRSGGNAKLKWESDLREVVGESRHPFLGIPVLPSVDKFFQRSCLDISGGRHICCATEWSYRMAQAYR